MFQVFLREGTIYSNSVHTKITFPSLSQILPCSNEQFQKRQYVTTTFHFCLSNLSSAFFLSHLSLLLSSLFLFSPLSFFNLHYFLNIDLYTSYQTHLGTYISPSCSLPVDCQANTRGCIEWIHFLGKHVKSRDYHQVDKEIQAGEGMIN